MDVLIIAGTLSVALSLLAFWGSQFVFLMMMEDELFPGRFDKIIWGAAFILVAPAAPFVFMIWRNAVLGRTQDGGQAGTRPAPGARR